MDNSATRELAMQLLHAETEEEVVQLLKDAELWDDPAAWRYYDDSEGNYSSAGNQQAQPEAALTEKVINSIDACLMRRCMEAGLDPRSAAAPGSIREAVAVFYEGIEPGSLQEHQGYIADWPARKQLEVAREITIAVTGAKPAEGDPSITIADLGEGQAPEMLPDTILSLDRRLKHRVRFVQGKFNMGGTGALRFAGRRNLQLVLSKRAPKLAQGSAASTAWGFTVVRRDDPSAERRVSAFEYLAPTGAAENPKRGGVLSFESKTLPIFPQGQNPYERTAEWGTVIKLYEYATKARSHMFMRSGLLERLGTLLPGPALPIRLHECRDYRGVAERSFETTLVGVEARLRAADGGPSANLEDGFPASGEIELDGERISYTIYAFRPDKAESYRRSEGVLFVVNGQTHAVLPDDFFRRAEVNMNYLRKSLLVVVDCSELSLRKHEELFPNSRDRLADVPFTRRLTAQLADLIKRHEGLRALREARRQAEISSKLSESRPMELVLRDLLNRSPLWAKLFLTGERLSNPFAQVEVAVAPTFVGRYTPTYFKFKDRPYGDVLDRTWHVGQRLRLDFDTDAANDYFTRRTDRGVATVAVENQHGNAVAVIATKNVYQGIGHVNITPADEAVAVGDTLLITTSVAEPSRWEPFVNVAKVRVLGPHGRGGGSGDRPERPETDTDGPMELRPAGIALPKMIPVYRDEWEKHEMSAESGVRIESTGEEIEPGLQAYDFYINMDNLFLQTELKSTRDDPALVKARFQFGLALLALGVLRHAKENPSADQEMAVEDFVARATDSLAPMLLPMIASLGSLTATDIEEAAEAEDSPEIDL